MQLYIIYIFLFFSRLAKDFKDDEIKDGFYNTKILKEEENKEDSFKPVDVNCKLYYNIMMIATEDPLSNKNIKLYLSSYDDEGVRLFLFLFNLLYYLGKLFENSLY